MISARLFLRALGLIFLAAFLSFRVQADGLIGRLGIAPSGELLAQARGELGPAAYRILPTLCWLHPGDAAVHVLCAAGCLGAILLTFDVAPAACLLLLWACYLSLATVAQPFLDFQWDGLLLETALLALFLAPWRLGRRTPAGPAPRSGVLLLRWLLFRLLFCSGVVKLASGDPAWRSLTALTRHYETQPLPTPIGWWAHQLPAAVQRLSAGAMFAMELVVPFFLFAPRRLRQAAAAAIAIFQAAIALTGNYAFFNVLTMALCLLVFDDRALAWLRPRRALQPAARPRPAPLRMIRPVLASLAFALSLVPTIAVLRPRKWPGAAVAAYGAVEPLRSFNTYGLFAVMTMNRPEILVEGSLDGSTWLPYEFRWKPGDPRRAPGFVAPHQPRLDWQMWFAALGDVRDNPWFVSFLRRLLEGSPPVLRLLASNPFPESPPRYVRATLYEYRFTDWPTRRRTGAWWRRERIGPYGPVLTLEPGRRGAPGSLRAVPDLS